MCKDLDLCCHRCLLFKNSIPPLVVMLLVPNAAFLCLYVYSLCFETGCLVKAIMHRYNKNTWHKDSLSLLEESLRLLRCCYIYVLFTDYRGALNNWTVSG